jgi:hypothetical protein
MPPTEGKHRNSFYISKARGDERKKERKKRNIGEMSF